MEDQTTTAEQVDRVVDLLRATLGPGLVAVYLYGSDVAGGLRPGSDLDLFVVTGQRTTPEQRQRLIDGLRPLSARGVRPTSWRPVELSIVALPEVVPWRYPPRMDFLSGEWLRGQFDAGESGPVNFINPDLAVLIAQVRLTGRRLVGPAAADVLAQVPRGDLVRAMHDSLESLMNDLATDTANVLLTLARIWYTIDNDAFVAKDVAADWASSRLATSNRASLARAHAVYLGDEPDAWIGLETSARTCADELVARIQATS